jgi:hypothetical protein
MISTAIILGSWFNSDQQSSHNCKWSEARIEMIEATTLLNAAASNENSDNIKINRDIIREWNDLFLTLYK